MPVILFTGWDGNIKRARFLDIFDGIIQKPCHLSDLLKGVNRVPWEWRKKLLDDVDFLELSIDVESDRINVNYIAKTKFENTSVLSDGFLMQKDAHPYLWIKKLSSMRKPLLRSSKTF